MPCTLDLCIYTKKAELLYKKRATKIPCNQDKDGQKKVGAIDFTSRALVLFPAVISQKLSIFELFLLKQVPIINYYSYCTTSMCGALQKATVSYSKTLTT